MRPAVLSISTERVLAPIRNAVLAHAGYGVIPAVTAESALKILRDRHVCAMIIASSVPTAERQALCYEGQRRGVPSVVLDPKEQVAGINRASISARSKVLKLFSTPWPRSCSAVTGAALRRISS